MYTGLCSPRDAMPDARLGSCGQRGGVRNGLVLHLVVQGISSVGAVVERSFSQVAGAARVAEVRLVTCRHQPPARPRQTGEEGEEASLVH